MNYSEEKVLIEKQILGLSGINNAAAILLIERYTNILKLIEKQVPKKPVGEHQCPRCKEVLHEYLQLYCGDCGQAIDWSEDV